jgi:hypothetical protein
MALRHFLLVYDLKAQRLVSQRDFEDGGEAAAAYADLEREYQGQPGYEVVLVGADSIETIRRTHAHYFDRTEAASPYLAGA